MVMGILVRKKRLFEDGNQQPVQNQQQNQTQTTDNTNTNQQPVQNQQQNQTNNANTNQQPEQNQQQTNNTNTNQQQNNNTPSPAAELNNKVQNCINFFKQTIEKNDPYALMIMNIPEKSSEMVPDFKKEHPKEKDAINAWEIFKKRPS